MSGWSLKGLAFVTRANSGPVRNITGNGGIIGTDIIASDVGPINISGFGFITSRIDSLKGSEPWPGYDELAVEEVRAVLSEGDDSRIEAVRTYERKHKDRAGVLQATERDLSNA